MLPVPAGREASSGVGAPPYVRHRPGFALIVHHTDAVREYAYDRDTKVGQSRKGARCGEGKRLDHREYEAQLEGHLSVRPNRRPVKRQTRLSQAVFRRNVATIAGITSGQFQTRLNE